MNNDLRSEIEREVKVSTVVKVTPLRVYRLNDDGTRGEFLDVIHAQEQRSRKFNRNRVEEK